MAMLDGVFIVAGAIAIIAAPLVLIYGIPYLRDVSHGFARKIGIASLISLAVSVFVALCAAWASQDIAAAEVKMKLASLDNDSRISIDGVPAQNSKEILSALKTLDRLPAHHSNPTKKIQIRISSHSDSLALSLARDSSDPREYWVFYRKHLITANNEIGRIKTPLLDAY